MDADLVVMGSGAAGLMAACVAADRLRDVVVVERSSFLGGTSAVSGGMLWIPNNRHMAALGVEDSAKEAAKYLSLISLGRVDEERLGAFVATAPLVIDYLEQRTPARFTAVMRPDYRPDLAGAKLGGRSLDNLPFAADPLKGVPVRSRSGLPIVHEERRRLRIAGGSEQPDPELIEERIRRNEWTLGAALVGALLVACRERGVRFLLETDVVSVDKVDSRDGRRVVIEERGRRREITARRGVVLAAGGFEWNQSWCSSYLPGPDHIPVSPPINEGDGIRLGIAAGAATAEMTGAWWVPAVRVPGETEEGRPRARHISDELALPGSILVNPAGRRFVNEATNYNDLSRAFAEFDIVGYSHINDPAWMVFDERFRSRYLVAGVAPADGPARWWESAEDLPALAAKIGVSPEGLVSTVSHFNRDAVTGQDSLFQRGGSPHDAYYGDPGVQPNPCLAPLAKPPFYAFAVSRGSFGTKGGLLTDGAGRLLDAAGNVVPGLWACGNTSAPVTGPGYPGAGATLASALTFGFLAGQDSSS